MSSGREAADRGAALDALVAVARRLEASTRLQPAAADPLLHAVAETAAVVLDAQAASIALHDPAREELAFVAAAGPQAGSVVGLSIPATSGIAGYAFSTGQPLAVSDVVADARFDRTIAEATGYVPGSLLATPLVDEEGVAGVLEVLDRRGGTFTLHDLDIAAALAREATIIIRRGRTEREATRVLRGALADLFAGDGTADPAMVDRIVSEVVTRVAEEADDPTWRLADRIAGLIGRDPDDIELAIEWLDALIRRSDQRTGRRRR
jgi:GAF domain-containing protein